MPRVFVTACFIKNSPANRILFWQKYSTVIFVHGCFWHGHKNCKYYTVPKTNTQWWTDKINGNKANDAKAFKALKKEGWKIITVWECQLKPAKIEKTLLSLIGKIR